MNKLGQPPATWKNGIAKDITLILTEDCNLQCKYCYICGKNSFKKMSFDTAKSAVDFLLDNSRVFPEDSAIFNFIGGEPFLEPELADKITDYIKVQMFKKNHKWFKSHMFNFSTNGINYHTSEVQNYIKKHRERLSIGMSVDGNKIKHDLQRVYADGRGSYDDVMKNVSLWQQQFPGFGTKATFASDDLPYLKDSVISLWENGITTVIANVVFEDVWAENDDIIFENQLKALADHIIEKSLYRDHNCSFFNMTIGNPLVPDMIHKNWCGAGKMIAIDCDGNFFPCVRFAPFSLNCREGRKIGDIESGIDEDKIRSFLALTVPSQSTDDCLNCEVASGCAWCQGLNYDDADSATIYQRATYICKMHKARVRANNYYWRRMEEAEGRQNSNGTQNWMKHLFFITADDCIEHCTYKSRDTCEQKMTPAVFAKALSFAERNFYRPVILGSKSDYDRQLMQKITSLNNLYISSPDGDNEDIRKIHVYNNNSVKDAVQAYNCILSVDRGSIERIAKLVIELFRKVKRVNLITPDPKELNHIDIVNYEKQLQELSNFLYERITGGASIELNVLTDRVVLDKMANCNAGLSSFAVGPNGKFYICPAYYFEDPENHIGDLVSGLNIPNQWLFSLERAPICSKCDAYHCRRCVYLNQKHTLETNTPSNMQCKVALLERESARMLNDRLAEAGKELMSPFPALLVEDPLELVRYQ